MVRTRMIAATMSAALVLSMGLGGCGGASTSTDAAKETETSQQAQTADSQDQSAVAATTRRVVGTEAEGALEVTLQNRCGAPVEALGMRVQGTLEYGADLLAGTPIAADEEVTLRVAPEQATPAVDVAVTLAGGRVVEIVGVPVSGVTHVALCLDGDAGYVDYVQTDGTTGTTHQETPAPEAAAAAAENVEATPTETGATDTGANVAEVAPAATESVVVEPVQDEVDVYVEQPPLEAPSEVVVDAPYEAPSAPTQTEDSCIEGGVMLKE